MTGTAFDPLAAALATSERHGHGIYLGSSFGARSVPIFARPQHGVLLLGPPRSGKTAAVVVPNVLAACGPVIAASTKADVLAATSAVRSRVGPVLLYDPSGSVPSPPGVERVGWSPLGLAGTWDGAVLVAESMVRAARPGTERGEASHWSERAGALLAVLLHAGALEHRPVPQVIAAVNRHDPDEARTALARHGAEQALDLLEGIVSTEGREQSGIWSTASGVLAGYRTGAALASTDGRVVNAADLLDSRGTLYVCAGSDHQRHAAPLVAGLIREVRSAVYQRSLLATAAGSAADWAGSSLIASRPPLLLVLDELANIAPLHDLPTLVAEGGSQGVVTLACLQDLAQARARWDREADGFLSLFGTKLIFPGIGDTRTLEAVSLLAGEHDVPTLSITQGPRRHWLGSSGRSRSRTFSTRRERRLPVDAIARSHPGCVLGIEGAAPGFLRMTPWYSSSPWREAVMDGRGRVRQRLGAVTAAETVRAITSGHDRTLGLR
ncbi:MAG TPA: TraM recognition domain-containing protein [Acidimicrobiales bacterium]|nr:TraM recognition domain-containing protein [Acidimicrobiales bacterium]